MGELVFVATIIFVIFVLYVVANSVSQSSSGSSGEENVPEAAASEPAIEVAAAPKREAAPAPVTASEAVAAPETASRAALTVRDPKTGETGPLPTNYRFTKRWIKDALVTEGLLDRVYKNTELDEEASEKVRVALEKFKALTKYHA